MKETILLLPRTKRLTNKNMGLDEYNGMTPRSFCANILPIKF